MKTKMVVVAMMALGLSACSGWYSDGPDYNKTYHSKRDSSIQLYPDGYDNGGAYAPTQGVSSKKSDGMMDDASNTSSVPAVPATTSFKARDGSWVGKQNPQGYTIELSNGENASEVASSLQKAPKSEPGAEVKYHKDGKQYYKGVYGSYPTYEAAQQALNGLPEDVKKGASVKTWGNIQSLNH